MTFIAGVMAVLVLIHSYWVSCPDVHNITNEARHDLCFSVAGFVAEEGLRSREEEGEQRQSSEQTGKFSTKAHSFKGAGRGRMTNISGNAKNTHVAEISRSIVDNYIIEWGLSVFLKRCFRTACFR